MFKVISTSHVVKFAACNDIQLPVFPKQQVLQLRCKKIRKREQLYQHSIQRAVRHAFFVRARTCTLFRVRDKTMLFEPFPPQAPTGCAKSRQSRRCSLSSAPPRVSSAARTNRSAAVVHLQYLLRCAVCIVFYFHTSRKEESSSGEHAT